MHCQKTINIFLETVLQLKPKAVILNGDTVDMLAISKYPKDIRHNYSLLEERIAYHKFLDDLLSVTATDTDIYEVSANHSGNGVEGRWFRYLSERLGELGCIPEIRDTLSYQNVFLGEYQKYVQYVDYVDLNGLTVIHGDVVRSAGGASALGMMQKWKTSLLMGHTHRLGMTCQRIPSIGNRPEAQLYAYEGGCACDLSPVYSSAPNWNQGFSIVGLGGETFSVEQVMVNAGIANIATLGQTLVG